MHLFGCICATLSHCLLTNHNREEVDHLQYILRHCFRSCNTALPSAKINISYSILFNLTTSYSSYFGGKKGISRNKTSFFLLMSSDSSNIIPFSLFSSLTFAS